MTDLAYATDLEEYIWSYKAREDFQLHGIKHTYECPGENCDAPFFSACVETFEPMKQPPHFRRNSRAGAHRQGCTFLDGTLPVDEFITKGKKSSLQERIFIVPQKFVFADDPILGSPKKDPHSSDIEKDKQKRPRKGPQALLRLKARYSQSNHIEPFVNGCLHLHEHEIDASNIQVSTPTGRTTTYADFFKVIVTVDWAKDVIFYGFVWKIKKYNTGYSISFKFRCNSDNNIITIWIPMRIIENYRFAKAFYTNIQRGMDDLKAGKRVNCFVYGEFQLSTFRSKTGQEIANWKLEIQDLHHIVFKLS